MISEDNFQYAVENTKVLLAPDRRIETFGTTHFRFYLISELMDEVGVVRVREGRIEADRPQIISPGHYSKLMLEGFGEQAEKFARWLENRPEKIAFLKYGFQFRKQDIVETMAHSPLEEVIERVKSGINTADSPLSAILLGVDDAWEVCLLKFSVDLVQQSAGGNMNDFRQRGLL